MAGRRSTKSQSRKPAARKALEETPPLAKKKPQRSAAARAAPERLIQAPSPLKVEKKKTEERIEERIEELIGPGDAGEERTKSDILKHKKKKELDANESRRNEYDRALGTFKGQISRFRQEQQMLMAYDAEGWKGASREKLKPHAELTKARETITRCLQIMRDCVKICDEAGGDKAIPRECFDEEGEVDCNDIFCGKCRESDSTDDNDIIMCDGMCDRAYHMKCVFPPLDASILEDDSEEGWLCPACDRKIDMIDELNDEFGTDYEYDDPWQKILSPETLPTDHDLYDFRTAAECVNGSGGSSKSWLDAFELPSDGDDSDEDFDGSEEDGAAEGEEGSADEEEEENKEASKQRTASGSSSSSSSSDSDSSNSLDSSESSESSDSESGLEEEEDLHNIEDVDTSGLTQLKEQVNGKKREDMSREELYKLLENEELEVVEGKRKRARVDYRALNLELFGDDDDDGTNAHGEAGSDDESDGVWSPTAKKLKSPLSE